MKGFKYISGAAAFVARAVCGAAVVLSAACTGYTDPASLIEVGVGDNKNEIFADGQDKITFTVTHNGNDVTGEASILDITNDPAGVAIQGNEFTTETPGRYTFVAVYGGTESLVPIVVTAKEATLVLSVRHVLNGNDNIFTFIPLYGTIDVSQKGSLKVFEVYEDGTPERELTDADKDGDFYTATTTGDERKSFYATWTHPTRGELKSPTLVVGPTKFYKKVGLLYFTGTWCTYCSVMAGNLKGIEGIYPDRKVQLSIHSNGTTPDPMTTDFTASVSAALSTPNTLPTSLIDLTRKGNGNYDYISLSSTTSQVFADRIRGIVEAGPASCGIAIATSVSGNTVTATVQLMSNETKSYGLMAALIESGVTGYPQIMPPGSALHEDPNYVHDYVVRRVDGNNIEGVQVGEVAGGSTIEKRFTFDLGGYNAANCSIAVFATTGNRETLAMANAAECKVGQSIDFRYEEIQ